jgi:glycosyltransferase involved in cell wall biosynthesis
LPSAREAVLKILHLNTYDVTGGAAQATYRLHTGLRRLGHDSSLLVVEKKSNDPTVLRLVPGGDIANRVRRRLRHERISRSFSRYRNTRPTGYELFSNDRTIYADDLRLQLPRCDVINLHWIAGFLDYRSFFSAVPKSVPIFWRLSDMNPMTGGCHFDHGCGKHNSACGASPQLGSKDSNDLSRQIWRRKEETFKALEPERLRFIALNRWMADLIARSPILRKFQVTVIPNGVDTEVFAPRDRKASREVLGIPQHSRVILFVADSIENRRKGFAELLGALNQLECAEDLFLLSVGGGSSELGSRIPYLHIGHVENRRFLSMVYSAADVYVIPSLQDNQPNTVLEAMACSTPVVAFDAGGISDMVRDGITGLLIPVGDVRGLRNALQSVLADLGKLTVMGRACRNLVLTEYTLQTQVRRYVDFYEKGLAAIRGPQQTTVGAMQKAISSLEY